MFLYVLSFIGICLICSPIHCQNNAPSIDVKKSIIYGPGLSSEIVLPVRYFFIQLVDINGKNFSQSPGDNVVTVSVDVQPKLSHLRFREDILDLQDGSYVVRIRLLESLLKGKIIFLISFEDCVDVRQVVMQAPLYSEHCNCPQFELSEWLAKLNCPATYAQIEKDFKSFPAIDGDYIAKTFESLHTNPHTHAACRYIVKSNRVYRKCFGEHTDFKMFSDQALLSLSWKTRLPDLDFIMNLGDWPLSSTAYEEALPIISWCGSEKSHDIVVPSYETMEWVFGMLNRVNLDVFRALANPHTNWSSKLDQAFWRGRDSSKARLDLVRFSLANPDYLDARLTAMFFFSNDSTLGQLLPPISFIDFFQYRYLINLDGTVAAYRLGLLLAGGSLILRQKSIYYEYFYHELKEMQHFLSIETDLTDLKERITWARKNQDIVSKIALKGRQFLKENFLPHNILCYYGRVLEKMSSRLIKNKIYVDNSFTEVLQADMVHKENCFCEKNEPATAPSYSKRDEL